MRRDARHLVVVGGIDVDGFGHDGGDVVVEGDGGEQLGNFEQQVGHRVRLASAQAGIKHSV